MVIKTDSIFTFIISLPCLRTSGVLQSPKGIRPLCW